MPHDCREQRGPNNYEGKMMIKFALLYRLEWCEERPALMLACAALCCHLAMWVGAV